MLWNYTGLKNILMEEPASDAHLWSWVRVKQDSIVTKNTLSASLLFM